MCGYKRDGFPGSQPVSMERDNLRLLAENKYMVSWKADGIRWIRVVYAVLHYFISIIAC